MNNFFKINAIGWRGKYFSQAFLKQVLRYFVLMLILSSCTKEDRWLTRFQLTEKLGCDIANQPNFKDIIITQPIFSPERIILKYAGKVVPAIVKPFEYREDGSLRKIRVIWVAQRIDAYENRFYDIYETAKKRISKPPLASFVGSDTVSISNNRFQAIISRNGLTTIKFRHNQTNLTERTVVRAVNAQQTVPDDHKNQLAIIENNVLYCLVTVNSTNKSTIAFKKSYFIFYNTPLIFIENNVIFNKNCYYNLFEPFEFKIKTSPSSKISLYGKEQLTIALDSTEHIYDYRISNMPETYIFLRYKKNLLKQIQYNYVGSRRKKTEKNLFVTAQIDSGQYLSFFTSRRSWKKHSSFHILNQDNKIHLSWHWHGFHQANHQNRLRKYRIGRHGKRGQQESFHSLLLLHQTPLSLSRQRLTSRLFEIFSAFDLN